MKVAITGHMSGLGKSLYNLFDDVVGFDLNNGFDIRNPEVIVEKSKDCDVFINNAYYKFCQVDLLELIFREWNNLPKTIVNISSTGADINMTSTEPFGFYPIHKRALDDAVTRLQFIAKECKVINIKPGWINTPMVADFPAEKMDPDELAIEIKDIILSEKNIRSVSLGNMGLLR